MDPRGLWVFLLHVLFASVQPCEIPGGNSHLIRALNVDLLHLIGDVSEEPNPSVYLALRLSCDHSLERERQYLQRLKDTFQPNSSRMPDATSSKTLLSTGQLALYLLALRAACHNMETPGGRDLVTQLKLLLHKEKQQIGPESSGRPITNYYQYSQGVLALCVHNKKVDVHVIHKLLHAEKRGKFGHGSRPSVDTEAMAGLAFICLTHATFYPPSVAAEFGQAVRRVREKILQAQTPEGAFGNVYGSPLALQFLVASGTSKDQPECPNGTASLLMNLQQGDFRNALTGSQLLPGLNGKSYVDLASLECRAERDNLEVSAASPEPGTADQDARRITVHLTVKHPPRRLPLYNQVLRVPVGSTLLDVLEVAQEKGPSPLTFETQQTLSGPLLTAVMGVKAQEGERKYWRLLRAPTTDLEQGIAEYVPKDEESIILKFSPW